MTTMPRTEHNWPVLIPAATGDMLKISKLCYSSYIELRSHAAQLAEFKGELGRRLASLDRGESLGTRRGARQVRAQV
jgi:hypothetical protein